MEKINIAELLKDCPQNMELDCTMFNKVTLFTVDDREGVVFPIKVFREDGNPIVLTKYGQYTDADFAKCIIFPKGKTTWEGFVPPCQFKDGDIITSREFGDICIFKGEGEIKGTVDFYCGVAFCNLNKLLIKNIKKPKTHFGNISEYDFASKQDKQKLFQAIKDNGYQWNAETKTLEKLIQPQFKVGDKVLRNYDTRKTNTISKVTLTENRGYVYWIDTEGCSSGWWGENELTPIPNKFDITTLKPFDKVLVRDSDKDMWCASIFSHTWKDKYFCIDTWHNQCIPYEANKKLLGTTNNPAEYGSE